MDDKLGTLEEGKLADILVIRGKPDEKLDDPAAVGLVIRDGYIVIEEGRVVVPLHVARPQPRPKESQ